MSERAGTRKKKWKPIETVGETLYLSYANLAMAHSAVQMGLKSYGVVSWSIRARLHKGLLTGTMDVGSLFADVREMPNDRCVYCAAEPPRSLHARCTPTT